jgi:hypothetical protein
MTMTSAAWLARAHDGGVADDDPAPKPTRRRFSAEYKLGVLDSTLCQSSTLIVETGPIDGHVGVVHEDVEAAVLVDHLLDDSEAVIAVTRVPLVHRCFRTVGTECANELGRPRGVGREARGDDCAAPGQAA